MLVLSRKVNEKIVIPSIGTSIEVVEVKAGRVRLGIDAPRSVQIVREEIASSPPAAEKVAPHADASRALEHDARNKLNTAMLSLELARQQLTNGAIDEAAETMRRALEQMSGSATREEKPSRPAAASQQADVLVVEDNADQLEMLTVLLRGQGFKVATATDGVDALNYLQRAAAPKVMLLDMMMPRCDGMTTVRIVRRNPVFDQIKIVAMSGYSPSHFGVAERAAGVDGWLQKPFEGAQLVQHVKQVLEGQTAHH